MDLDGLSARVSQDLNQDVSWARLLARGSEKICFQIIEMVNRILSSGFNNEIPFPCGLSAKIALCSLK